MTVKLVVTQKTFALADEKKQYEFAGSLDYDAEWKTWNAHVNMSSFGKSSEKEVLMVLAETALRLHDELTQAVKEMQDAEKGTAGGAREN